MNIDEELRKKNAKLHSAGHLIDLAVQKLGTFMLTKDTNGPEPKATTSKTVPMSSIRDLLKDSNRRPRN